MTASTRTVAVGDVQVRIMEAGQGSPLVFLHGAGGASWSPGLDLLSDRFHVYLPEHPGFGDTNRPEWLETVLDMAVYYLDWLAAMGLGQVTLVGQSLGGWIAAELSSLCNHGLARLALVDAAGLHIPGEQRVDMFTLSPEKLARTLYHDPSLAEQALSQEPTPEIRRVQVRNRNMAARLGWNPYLCNPALEWRLRRIGVPALVMWGVQDALIPVSHAHLYAEAIPGAELALIEPCGHLPPVEQPEEFARLVTAFAEREGK